MFFNWQEQITKMKTIVLILIWYYSAKYFQNNIITIRNINNLFVLYWLRISSNDSLNRCVLPSFSNNLGCKKWGVGFWTCHLNDWCSTLIYACSFDCSDSTCLTTNQEKTRGRSIASHKQEKFKYLHIRD